MNEKTSDYIGGENLTEFCQISLKILPYFTAFSPQLTFIPKTEIGLFVYIICLGVYSVWRCLYVTPLPGSVKNLDTCR